MSTTNNTQLTPEQIERAIEARRAYARRWKAAHADHVREYQRRYYAEHPERQREYNLRYWLRRAQREAEDGAKHGD